ncbi:ParB/RepB/Spo0J family partition protein [Mangrovicoccus sp. HB161399]|uniref:ParB/RepB/Spo0J family partition protein n=1 Tax=Mangrovicoccus sp. HB161399 TaxID=2720392 RepID=UPI0015564DCA|nr:ParB/RepB/Spo0J family partition protein [Mangrovicoccus sp. HB161399]
MSKSKDAAFGDLLSGLEGQPEAAKAAGPDKRRKRKSSAAGAGSILLVDPAACRIWAGHNRSYGLLDEEACSDLIAGIRAQGCQEFPAIVREVQDGGADGQAYEVICGARRHFAVAWLRENGHTEMQFLVELRDLGDEEAFRLADVENRHRRDISDYERACSYAVALERYYGGTQSVMARRLEVSESWLSRRLALARLPEEIVAAYASIRDILEVHARQLAPLLSDPGVRKKVLAVARDMAAEKAEGTARTGAQVLAALLAPARPPAAELPAPKVYGPSAAAGIAAIPRGRKLVLEVPPEISRAEFDAAIREFVRDRFGDA